MNGLHKIYKNQLHYITVMIKKKYIHLKKPDIMVDRTYI